MSFDPIGIQKMSDLDGEQAELLRGKFDVL